MSTQNQTEILSRNPTHETPIGHNETGETRAQEYGRRCADAMNARDTALYLHFKKMFDRYKITLGVFGQLHDEANSQFNKAYRENKNYMTASEMGKLGAAARIRNTTRLQRETWARKAGKASGKARQR